MSPDEAEEMAAALAMLLASLTEVRRKFDADDDDWRYTTLRTFREYARTIGVDTYLLDPVEKMLLEAADDTFRQRRRKEGKRGAAASPGTHLPLIFAAAAISTLKHRGDCKSIGEAAHLVARKSGIDRKRLTGFRDNINRGLAPNDVASGYEDSLAKLASWSKQEILMALSRIDRFVK